ncbi:NAD(P)H-binding protein [Actinoplanes sp. NEAU-A12]|uniref:NAD(P)H-binding protein n=1 Tax=Actinoplanes sandaracinus TaxID=3045177 RepID=A0ABT6WVB0_9ACTN|nr:NAD(P)H-binding protein [Actinoplanes sandaracinus]MDI6103649.1 NAD(P)H-binding protein [Actinoplanes sandaracinus]
MKHILVTGSTGTLGRQVAGLLRTRGADVRGLSRRPGQAYQGDLATGAGLDAALDGAGAVVHCASDTRRFGRSDIDSTRNLLATASRTGHPHVIFVSIVGVDRIPYPYYRIKLEAEGLIDAYGGTILRATQFHDFVLGGARIAARLPLVFAPDVPVQPISTQDVAARIADLVDTPVPGRAADLGGPEVLRAPEVFRSYLAATGSRRRLVPVRLPGATFRAFRDGAHLAPANPSSGERWSDFLTARFPATGTT